VTDTVAGLVGRARDPRASIGEQHAAFARLVERFERMALATALRASDDAESARDACQEAFLVAWRTLPRLREPAAFGVWLQRLIRTQCRKTRGAAAPLELETHIPDPRESSIRESDAVIRRAVNALPSPEREAILLFHFLGESLRAVARELDVSEARAGKLVYEGRLRLRGSLPRSVAEEFLARRPTTAFTRRVRAGVFDEIVGDYRFEKRPELTVRIRREGDRLVSYAAHQRHVLASRASEALVATEFDGEGRFRRDARGRVKDFIYYEFGKRLGVARKI
jgi:RNA polymerase sigma-70 factor (ECF subfamily)